MFKVWNLRPQSNGKPANSRAHADMLFTYAFSAGSQPLSMTQAARAGEADILLRRLREQLARRGAR